MVAIYDFTLNPMYQVLSGHSIMSDIHENSMIDIKIMNLLNTLLKYVSIISIYCTYGDHLGFYPKCNVHKYFLTTPLDVRHPRKPYGRQLKHDSTTILLELYQFIV